LSAPPYEVVVKAQSSVHKRFVAITDMNDLLY